MRARRTGKCGVCGDPVAAGDDIEKLCGAWSHARCKRDELTRRIAQKDYTEVVPTEDPIILEDDFVGTRYYRRRGIKFLTLGPRR